MENKPNSKPCIALMGEFSAGKSTLANLMLGASPLPVQVIATRLPPVRISYGTSPAARMDLEGRSHPIDLADLANIPLASTQLIQIFRRDEILRQCDIIDMPGISDPNMDVDVWPRVLPFAHAVIWCSHATQAWRQSEAAFWDQMPKEIQERSILLLTRIDKIAAESDRHRLMQRVLREAGEQFSTCLPIALLDAHSAGTDQIRWQASGAAAFADAFVYMVERTKAELAGEAWIGQLAKEPQPIPERPKIVPRRVTRYAG